MKLTREQQQRIRELHGICVNEACDRCGQVLAEARFTRKDKPGEWCSRKCRDGEAIAKRYSETRKRGRPRQHESRADRQRAYRNRQVVSAVSA